MSATAPTKITVFNTVAPSQEGPSFAAAKPLRIVAPECPQGWTQNTKLVKNSDGSWTSITVPGCEPIRPRMTH
jgi:hypothetical protein